jgi:hypothetical protein
MNDLEQNLRRQPFRQVPANWRGEILSSAKDAALQSSTPRGEWFSILKSQLSTLLWPNPKAWTGLAAIWIFIFTLHVANQDEVQVAKTKSTPPSPEVMLVLRQQQQLRAELVGVVEANDAERPKTLLPRPRSERSVGFSTV